MLDCSTFGNDARQSEFLHTAEIGYYDSNYLKLQGYTAGSGHEIQPGAQSVH
jgi:hypothetical protein